MSNQPCGCEKLRTILSSLVGQVEHLEFTWPTLNKAKEALARPCQQASVGSEWTTTETRSGGIILDIGAISMVFPANETAQVLRLVAEHNAALRRSAPADAWRDLHPNEKSQNGDRTAAIFDKQRKTIWQRRVSAKEKQK